MAEGDIIAAGLRDFGSGIAGGIRQRAQNVIDKQSLDLKKQDFQLRKQAIEQRQQVIDIQAQEFQIEAQDRIDKQEARKQIFSTVAEQINPENRTLTERFLLEADPFEKTPISVPKEDTLAGMIASGKFDFSQFGSPADSAQTGQIIDAIIKSGGGEEGLNAPKAKKALEEKKTKAIQAISQAADESQPTQEPQPEVSPTDFLTQAGVPTELEEVSPQISGERTTALPPATIQDIANTILSTPGIEKFDQSEIQGMLKNISSAIEQKDSEDDLLERELTRAKIGLTVAQQQKLLNESIGGEAKNLTEGQRKTLNQFNRMRKASRGLLGILREKDDQGNLIDGTLSFDPTSFSSGFQRILPNMLRGENLQMYDSVASAWAQALLRLDSGAAVPETEVKRYVETFLPRFGDGPQTIEAKLRLMQSTEDTIRETLAMEGLANPYREMHGRNAVTDHEFANNIFSSQDIIEAFEEGRITSEQAIDIAQVKGLSLDGDSLQAHPLSGSTSSGLTFTITPAS